MRLHRTPLHHTWLHAVHNGRVEWLSTDGISGGFVGLGAKRLTPDVLVALWELNHARLICVDRESGVVSLTPQGFERLSEWDATNKVRVR